MTGASIFWLWVTAGGMILATVVFLYLAATGRRENLHHYITSSVITLWAGIMYVLMASGSGVAQTDGGTETFFFLRYVDWVITTPLLLLGLSWVALGGLGRRSGTVLAIVAADVVMIIFGFFAALQSGGFKYLWFIISAIAFIVMLYLIWGPLRSEAGEGQTRDTNLFFPLAAILTVLWILYPIVWLLGTEGGGAIGSSVEVFFFAVLDILAKVGFGLYLLNGVRRNAAQGVSGTGGARSARVS